VATLPAGSNVLPVCHAMNLAATVVSVAAAAMAGKAPPASGRYVLAVEVGGCTC
jgi:hypothetical protein